MKAIVVAMDRNRGIGFENDMPWGRGLKDDQQFFKKITTPGSVIMGRNTFESMNSRPLPDRENIVVTSKPTGVPGVLSVTDIESAYALARYPIFVIGGGQIYSATIDDMDILYVTEVDGEFPEATVFFPEIDMQTWHEVSREHHDSDERNSYPFAIVTYKKGSEL